MSDGSKLSEDAQAFTDAGRELAESIGTQIVALNKNLEEVSRSIIMLGDLEKIRQSFQVMMQQRRDLKIENPIPNMLQKLQTLVGLRAGVRPEV